jgi:hypothetical protein
MQSWVGYPEKDQVKLRKLITNAAEEVAIAERIYGRVQRNEWLDAKDAKDRERYDALIKEDEKLVDDLFPQNK